MKRLTMALALIASPALSQSMQGTYAPNARVVIGKYDPSLATASLWVAEDVPTNNFASVRVDGDFNGSGGSPGLVSSNVRVNTNVGSSRTDFVWGITSVLDNRASGGQNVSVYGQALKESGAGPTWGGVFDAKDLSNAANPTSGLVALELDLTASGGDANNQRIGLDLVGYKGASAPAIGYGIRIGPQAMNPANASFQKAIFLSTGYVSGFTCGGVGGVCLDASQAALSGATVRFPPKTVSSLPACNSNLDGGLSYVTDALAPTWNSPAVGGGSVKVMVFCDSVSWKVH